MLNDKDFMYKAFFRSKPPSILRLAFIQLLMEGVNFEKENYEKLWNLIWDRGEYIVNRISCTKEAKDLHKRLLNERTF